MALRGLRDSLFGVMPGPGSQGRRPDNVVQPTPQASGWDWLFHRLFVLLAPMISRQSISFCSLGPHHSIGPWPPARSVLFLRAADQRWTGGGEVLMTDQTDAESDYQYLHSLSCQSVWSARVAATALDRRPTGMPQGGDRRGGDRKSLR